jgi:hypothetical protein
VTSDIALHIRATRCFSVPTKALTQAFIPPSTPVRRQPPAEGDVPTIDLAIGYS